MTKNEFIQRLQQYATKNKEYYSFMFNYTHALSLDIYELFKLLGKLYLFIANNINNEKLSLKEKDLKEIISSQDVKDKIKIIFLKITKGLIGSHNYDNILLNIQKIEDVIWVFIREELIEISWQEVKQYCPDVQKNIIIKRSETILDYEDLRCFSQEILDQQIQDNNIPDISKEFFLEKYPEFAENMDKDGLVDLSLENYELVKKMNSDGMFYKDYFIYYDDFFIEYKFMIPGFLDIFFSYFNETQNKGNIFKIKLNYHKIISTKKYKQVILVGAGFYGPNFKKDDIFTRIQNKTITTKKLRNNPKFSERFNNHIKETEFFLDQENSSFQIEEISQDIKNKYITNRFIHSEFDIDNKVIKHLDGTLLYYNPQEYHIRESDSLEKNQKTNEKKEKIFRIDGKIDVEKWKELILQFFIHNEMILEYFDFDAYKEEYKDILNYEEGVDY